MARTRWPPICESRPLAQARQIGPAAPVGALNDQDPADGPASGQPERASGQIASQTGSQPDHTPVATRNHGSRAEAHIHILPADSLPRALTICGLHLLHRSPGSGLRRLGCVRDGVVAADAAESMGGDVA